MDCPFCGDVEIKEKSRLVASNELAFCLVNFEPLKPGHVMVIPRRHVIRVSELTPAESNDIHRLIDQMADALERLYPGEPSSIGLNHGSHKSVPHLHYHILPAKGSIREHFAAHEGVPSRVRRTREELATMAEHLRKVLV